MPLLCDKVNHPLCVIETLYIAITIYLICQIFMISLIVKSLYKLQFSIQITSANPEWKKDVTVLRSLRAKEMNDIIMASQLVL